MPWWRSTVNKVIEEQNRNMSNFSHIRNIVDNVILNAGHVVSGGATLLQDHFGGQIRQRLKQIIEKVEDDSISCHGKDRVVFLQKLLASLQQNEESIVQQKHQVFEHDKNMDDYKQSTQVSNYNPPHANSSNNETHNFYDTFLQSKVIEGILVSMILDAPDPDEVNILMEIFRLSLIEGNEVHIKIVHWINDLARVFSAYHEEILMRREELLQYAQDAISGLKKNVEFTRRSMEAKNLKARLYCTKTKPSFIEDFDRLSQLNCLTTVENLNKTLSSIGVHSTYTTLMLRNINTQNWDSLESHDYKVNKLKVLLRSLTYSTTKAEKRILDNENHKTETQQFCQIKATEVSLTEKDLIAEIKALEEQKEELEFEINKINNSLDNAKTCLDDVKEEWDQFEEANNKILQHLQKTEEQHSKQITLYRGEANVIIAWHKLIEDTWSTQNTIFSQFESQVFGELRTCRNLRYDIIISTLKLYEHVFKNMMAQLGIIARRLRSSEELENVLHLDDENYLLTISRENLEEEYSQFEIEVINAFHLIDCIQQCCTHDTCHSREEEENIRRMFETFQNIREEFRSLERPNEEREIICDKLCCRKEALTTNMNIMHEIIMVQNKPHKQSDNDTKNTVVLDTSSLLEFEEEEEATDLESAELINPNFAQDITDWEFDAIDK